MPVYNHLSMSYLRGIEGLDKEGAAMIGCFRKEGECEKVARTPN